MGNNNKLYSEIFDEFGTETTRDGRLGVLRKYQNNKWFTEFLNYAFNPKIRFDILKVPNYKPAVEPAGLNFTYLNNEMRRLYIFIAGHPKRTAKLDARKEERILNALLGSLHKDEAVLLVKLFQKNLGVKYLTARLVKEAFPFMPFEVAPTEAELEAASAPATKASKSAGATLKL
jgi:hypothetical protein